MTGDKNKKQVMQIGDLAKRVGISVRAIRYYEELGLINPAAHSSGGFRLYGVESRKRLEVINLLKTMGLSLTEIRQIFHAKKPSGGDKDAVHKLQLVLSGKVKLVDAKIESLTRMKSDLSKILRILKACESCGHDVLLDAICCKGCACLAPRDSVPETFEVILQ